MAYLIRYLRYLRYSDSNFYRWTMGICEEPKPLSCKSHLNVDIFCVAGFRPNGMDFQDHITCETAGVLFRVHSPTRSRSSTRSHLKKPKHLPSSIAPPQTEHSPQSPRHISRIAAKISRSPSQDRLARNTDGLNTTPPGLPLLTPLLQHPPRQAPRTQRALSLQRIRKPHRSRTRERAPRA